MNNDPLVFEFAIAKDKPSSFRKDKNNVCPFCDTEHLLLQTIYQKRGPMIWLPNRFPTLKDTLQTVLVESDEHNGDVGTYSKEYNRQLMKFAYECFSTLQKDSRYRSVLWYKNFGPKSNGSLVHPHMQIVALEKEDGYKYIHPNNFEGITFFRQGSVEANMALHPVQGFQEININFENVEDMDVWSDWIQIGVNYTLQKMYNGRCDSYNLFFYPHEKGICCKIVPRFYAPPYFVGYKLSERNDKKTLAQEAERIKKFAQD